MTVQATFRGHAVQCRLGAGAPGRISGRIVFEQRGVLRQDFLPRDPNAPEDEIHLDDGRKLICRINTFHPMDDALGFIGGRFE